MQKKNKFQLILGSQSPRRKELLQWICVPFKIVTSDIDELSEESEVTSLVMDLANQKAQAVYELIKDSHTNPVVIGADTIVVLGNQVMGKPKDRSDAKLMLEELMGKTHRVLTGVSILHFGGKKTFYDETLVSFDEISEELLNLYLDTGESLDKAGSYGIQGAALGFINRIEGSYSNVVGLPVNLVLKELKSILDFEGQRNWREQFEN